MAIRRDLISFREARKVDCPSRKKIVPKYTKTNGKWTDGQLSVPELRAGDPTMGDQNDCHAYFDLEEMMPWVRAKDVPYYEVL
jgi:hypothetical protein